MRSALALLYCAGMLACLFFSSSQAARAATGDGPTVSDFLPRTGQILTYDQAGKAIDYRASGQDGESQRDRVWPEPRFVSNGDGTITDLVTGLMWLKLGNCFGDQPWPTAAQSVAEFNQGEVTCPGVKVRYADWFLPDINQLASLIDAQAVGGGDALRVVGFSDVQNGVYWSSTPARNQQKAWSVDFASGEIASLIKLERHFIMVARAADGKGDEIIRKETPSEPTTRTAARFVSNGDGTITDNLTGLMWLQDASCLPPQDWSQALTAVKRLGSGGANPECSLLKVRYSDWSLPNVVELRSLLDYSTDYPALSPDNPLLHVLASGYWSSTTAVASPDHAFVADLETGDVAAIKKSEKRRILAMRSAVPMPDRPRKQADMDRGITGVDPRYVLAGDPDMASEIKWPPDNRFASNGDGTSLDIITGINWLTDANCFGRKSWREAVAAIERFNTQSSTSAVPEKRTQMARKKEFPCEGYDGGADDWVLPTHKELLDLSNAAENDGAAELNRQGIVNVQSNGSYWSTNENPLNLYFANAVNLKTGKAGNYPKSIKFFVWPHRQPEVEEDGAGSEPLLNLTANAIGNFITVSPDTPLSLVVYLYTFGTRSPADFWFWYDTPDEKRLWLTSIRSWTDQAVPVFQGPLFNLINYEIFRSVANKLPPGVYDFHFAVDPSPNGVLDEVRTEISMSVVIPAGE